MISSLRERLIALRKLGGILLPSPLGWYCWGATLHPVGGQALSLARIPHRKADTHKCRASYHTNYHSPHLFLIMVLFLTPFSTACTHLFVMAPLFSSALQHFQQGAGYGGRHKSRRHAGPQRISLWPLVVAPIGPLSPDRRKLSGTSRREESTPFLKLFLFSVPALTGPVLSPTNLLSW